MARGWELSPKDSVLAEVERTSPHDVAARCMALLSGGGVADRRFLYVLAGPASRPVLEGREGGVEGYWPRVWALRALRYVWDDDAAMVVVDATADGSWRVREMAAKVIGARGVDEGLEALGRLAEDPVTRVRSAALAAQTALSRRVPRSRRAGRGVPPS